MAAKPTSPPSSPSPLPIKLKRKRIPSSHQPHPLHTSHPDPPSTSQLQPAPAPTSGASQDPPVSDILLHSGTVFTAFASAKPNCPTLQNLQNSNLQNPEKFQKVKFVGDSAESETGVADGAEVTVEVSDEEKRLEDCAEGEGEGEYGSGEETLELEYWDSLYEANAEEETNSEYLLSYFTLRPVILPHMHLLQDEEEKEQGGEAEKEEEEMRVLVPGCGDSSLSESLDVDGFEVYATDISSSVIEIMKNKVEDDCGVIWKVDDATKMAFSDEFFHFIVDKSLIDCIYWVKDEGVLIDQVIQQTLSEYHRTLHPSGCAIIVTIRDTKQFLPFIDKKLPHCVPEFQERREEKQVPGPPHWVYLSFEILAEKVDGAVPTNAEAIELDSEDEESEILSADYAKFYVYVLRKE